MPYHADEPVELVRCTETGLSCGSTVLRRTMPVITLSMLSHSTRAGEAALGQ